MDKVREWVRFIREKYDLLVAKKYTTIAGTLVFFLIMSIMPFSFWLTLLLGKLPLNGESVLRMDVFDSVKDVFEFIRDEAKNATAGASVFLVLTTLYSATNLFYQMRKSGEIVYNYNRKGGIRSRLSALVLLLIVMIFAIVALAAFAIGSFVFSKILTGPLNVLADYALLAVISFAFVWLLNAYACPYKIPFRTFLPGTALTVVLWGAALVGFALYLKLGNIGRLYGALSAVIVFLLWLYVLMICFVVGMIFNYEKVKSLRENKKFNDCKR